MKRINVAALIPGMVTAEDIFSFNEQLILPKGTVLTDKTITKLEFYYIISIRILDDDGTSESSNEVKLPLEDPSFSKRIKSSQQFVKFKETFDENLDNFKNVISDVVEKNAPVDVASTLNEALGILQTCNSSGDIFNMLHNMRQYDDLTFAHCLNVGLICNVFCDWLNFSEEDKEIATACGLFHDIGKLAIPENIVKKPAKLTDAEYNVIKTHPMEGYNVLKNQNINIHIKNAALMHHERCDGGGYPLGLTGDKIDRFAKIVSIADVYDAMTAARVYRGPLCPFKVIEIFEKEGLQRYDAEYILTFLENIILTYMNNRVRLSNGEVGDIVFINKQHYSKPMVKTEKGFIDLSKEKDLSIESIL